MANHRNFAQTTLAAAITDTSGTSITVTSEASFPAAPFIISIDTECLLVTVVSGTTWTVTRGYEGSTAATHLNGATVYHDWSAGEADSTVHGPASATTEHLAVFDGATGKIIKDGGAVPAAGLPTTGGTMTGNLVMDNMDIALVKLLTLHGEIDDGAGASTINWNLGAVHKVTLTGDVTLAFTGYGADAIPTMTSNTTPSGVASASSEFNASYAAWKAMNDVGGLDRWTTATDDTTPSWLQYQFATAKTIRAYSLMPSAQDTKTWTLQGSNNGTDWTTLDSRSGVSLTYQVANYFAIAAGNQGSYLYYRLSISSGTPRISEFQLIDSAVADPASPCFLALKLVQDANGGHKITWPATVKGTPLYDLAINATTVLLFYWDGTYYWVLNNSGWVSTVPASATAKGIAGQYTANGSYFYYCSATDTWVRTALATWT